MAVNTQDKVVKALDVKRPTTYEEQAALIEVKGFHIEDLESCISFLNQANYYRLSAYFLPFRKKDGTYIHGIKFNRIKHIYEFDSRIRSVVFQTIEQIEFYTRTQLSTQLALNYGALGYLEPTTYSTHHDSVRFLEKIQTCISENKRTPVVQHHIKKYGGRFPIWVIIEFFSMGMLSYLYANMRTPDKKEVAHESFHTSAECLESWLRCITDLRNRCAHYSRLYYWSFPAIPKMPRGITYQADRKLFSQLLMLKFLYPDANQWNAHVLIEIETLIDEYESDISLKHIGFPSNWRTLLTI